MSITLGEATVVVETPELVIEGDLPEFIVVTEGLSFEITVEDPMPDFVEAETPTGVGTIVPVPGVPGPSGDGLPELFDDTVAPTTPPDTYLRFSRDVDGDVQTIYLGTVS